MRNLLRLTLAFFLLLILTKLSAQPGIDRRQIYFQDFNDGVYPDMELNSGRYISPDSSRSVNRWRISDHFSGQGKVADVPAQTSVSSGRINRPGYRYLHVRHTETVPALGAHYLNDRSADVFTKIGSFCAAEADKILISFYYTAGGNETDYAEFYVGVTGQPWQPLTPKGATASKLESTTGWKYVEFEYDPAAGKGSVDLGIRWRNAQSSSPAFGLSFGMDDLSVVGIRNPDKPKPQLLIGNLSERVFCSGNNALSFLLTHTTPSCTGSYEVQLSNQAGEFTTYTPLAVNNPYPFTGSFTFTSAPQRISLAPIPCGIPQDSGYRIRVRYISSFLNDTLYSEPSPTITLNQCQNTVGNLVIQTAEQSDTLPDRSICVGSYFIVTHNSTGCFKGTNNYILELSDENGQFDDTAGGTYRFLGQVISEDPDARAYPAIPPNSFSPLIPYRDRFNSEGNLIQWRPKPGCNYRVRVRVTGGFVPDSSNELNRKYFNPEGEFVSQPSERFCIKDCAIETNETNPIILCVDSESKDTVVLKVPFSAYRFFKPVRYGKNNQFLFEVYNYGALIPVLVLRRQLGDPRIIPDDSLKLKGYEPNDYFGPFPDTLIFKLPKPEMDSLTRWNVPPGGYFMRIIATESVLGDGTGAYSDHQGTLIPLSIGVPQVSPLVLAPAENQKTDLYVCNPNEPVPVSFLIKNINFRRNSTGRFYFIPSDTALSSQDIQELKDTIDFYKRGGEVVTLSRLATVVPGTKLITFALPPAGLMSANYFYIFVSEQSGGDTCRGPVSDPIVFSFNRLFIDKLLSVTPSDCKEPTGTARIRMADRRSFPMTATVTGLDSTLYLNTFTLNERTLDLTGLPAGKFKLELVDYSGCDALPFEFTVPQTQKEWEEYTLINARDTVCTNQTAILGGYELKDDVTYLWSPAVGLSGTDTETVTFKPLRIHKTDTLYQYTLTVKGKPGTCYENKEQDFPVQVFVWGNGRGGCELISRSLKPENVFILAPNPTHGIVTLTGAFNRPLFITLTEPTGKTVFQNRSIPQNGSLTIDIGHLPAGVYFLTLTEPETGFIGRHKIILNR